MTPGSYSALQLKRAYGQPQQPPALRYRAQGLPERGKILWAAVRITVKVYGEGRCTNTPSAELVCSSFHCPARQQDAPSNPCMPNFPSASATALLQ
ncbi:hypothetical protein SRHO_G00001210 [Serrasalmus rhombeus]